MLSDGRRIVDSFLVSEPHEAELLLAKFHAGAAGIDEFVAIEGAYTFRGEHKGLWLDRALHEDARFVPFRDRVHVVECHENMYQRRGASEDDFFKVEYASRELSRPYITSRYSGRDLVTCSDVDELLDFSDPVRAAQLDAHLVETSARKKISCVQLLKFWYDFDNLTDQPRWFPVGPLAVVGDHWNQRRVNSESDLLRYLTTAPIYCAFEYSFCFPREAIMRKLMTFAHDGYTQKDIDDALAGNYWVKCAAKGERQGQWPHENFRTVTVDETNSTAYVRDNFARLRTNNVGAVSKLEGV